MKYLIIVLVLVCSCVVSLGFQSTHPGAATLPQLSAMGKIVELTHLVSKRQTDRSSLADECFDIRVDYECGPSGYSQQLIDIALACRNETYARDIANGCARSENGDLCKSATSRFFKEQRQEEGALPCSLTESCPSACRSFLETARRTLGCCINTYINTTVNPLLDLYSDYVDYRLWTLCNVPLPAADCENGLPLNPPQPQDSQDCTFQELINRMASHTCSPAVGQPLVNVLLQDNKCQTFATAIIDICSINSNDEYCAAIIGSDVVSESGTSNNTDPLLGSLFTECDSSAITFCNSSCQSAITNIADSYGCCVNIFNDSDSVIFNYQLLQLSYAVWNSCGVESPGFCTSTLSSGSQIMKGFAWMIAAVAMVTHVILHR